MNNLPTWHPANFKQSNSIDYIKTLFVTANSPTAYIPDLFQKDWVTINGNHVFINEDGSYREGHSASSHDGGVAADRKGVEPDKKVTVGDKTFPLTNSEQAVMDKVGVTVRNNSNYMGAFGVTDNPLNGDSPTINMDMQAISKYNTDPNATFYHEFGHVVDAHQSDSGAVNASAQWQNAVAGEVPAIITNRIARSPSGTGLTNETISAIANGSPSQLKGMGISTEYMDYLRSPKEVFADAYGQYRTAPALLEKTAPNTYAYFAKTVH